MTTPTTDPTADPKTTLLAIDGMTCGSCVRHIHQALTALNGVERVEVQFSRKQALVVHAPEVPIAELLRAVDDAGYDASVATR
ncbi:MAG: heavy-metal-associated domain-containing protein [Planctomycetes bacterium]|nr:heavy-metal-associated domain-containing protein [Planctomycetota bacterium]